MHIDDTISEFIGALANMAVKNKSGKITSTETLEILKIAKIENPIGGNYKEHQGLVTKAIDYWKEKDQPTVVNNIKNILL
jgi:hypothetical protein